MNQQRKARLQKIFSKLDKNVPDIGRGRYACYNFDVNQYDGSLTLVQEEHYSSQQEICFRPQNTTPPCISPTVQHEICVLPASFKTLPPQKNRFSSHEIRSSRHKPEALPHKMCVLPTSSQSFPQQEKCSFNQDIPTSRCTPTALQHEHYVSPASLHQINSAKNNHASLSSPEPDSCTPQATQIIVQADVHFAPNDEYTKRGVRFTPKSAKREKHNDIVVKSTHFINPKYIKINNNKQISVSTDSFEVLSSDSDRGLSATGINKKIPQTAIQVLPEQEEPDAPLLLSPPITYFTSPVKESDYSANKSVTEVEVERSSPSILTISANYMDTHNLANLNTLNSQPSRKRTITEETNVTDIEDNKDLEEVPRRKRSKRSQKCDWEKSKQKELREKGQKYKGKKKEGNVWNYSKSKEERTLKRRCECKLSGKPTKLKCLDITEESRKMIFQNFWTNMSWQEKKIYIKTLTTLKPTQRKKAENEISRRNNSLELYLEVDSVKYRVCKKMFLNTLDIGEWTLLNWTKCNKNNDSTDSTKIENQTDINTMEVTRQQTVESKKEQHVTTFFDMLPKLDSHYCRSQTSKLYLEPLWESKAQLLEEYDNYAKEKGYDSVSSATLSNVFEKMNLSLFRPKKDLCNTCESYKCKNISEETYVKHCQMKEAARKEKNLDKETDKEVLSMDLQSVLLCPKSNASALYYKTKLIVHNFTVYDMKRLEGYCFIWNETEGSLSANEFSSIIIRMLELFMQKYSLNEGSEIILYSDGCTYQNRNATLSNALLNFAVHNKMTIVQKILEKGHTQMEADSMHSVIERQVRHKKINVPADYVNIAKTACKIRPYYVEYLDHTFFRNYETLKTYKSIRPGKKKGDPVVTDLRQLKYLPEGQILYRLGYTEEYDENPLPERVRLTEPVITQDIPLLYTERLKIKKSKFEHLQQLKEVLEVDYHAFYDAIPFE